MNLILLIILLALAKPAIKYIKRSRYYEQKHEQYYDEDPFKPRKTNQTQVPHQPEQNINIDDYSNKYQRRYLLTKNEWNNYKTLIAVAAVKNYVVCPKVRLLDIIEPRKEYAKYKTLLYKIQAKHVDFVICDQNMNIRAIIELDDNSHNTTDRKERDQFVDLILRSVGYKIIHTRHIGYDILDLV